MSPDTEDVNGDYSMNELDRYYEWKISLRPEDLVAGRGFITSSRRVEAQLRDGRTSPVTWYQFKVPLSAFTSRIGGISDLRSVRFMRLYLTGFDRETQLRFASLRLVRGDWRTYEGSLDEGQPRTQRLHSLLRHVGQHRGALRPHSCQLHTPPQAYLARSTPSVGRASSRMSKPSPYTSRISPQARAVVSTAVYSMTSVATAVCSSSPMPRRSSVTSRGWVMEI